ncbi:ribonuclease HII [bacterium CG2_30_37_16]|nr:MAG: ribonuclease HII [bacterium CG2_30_37_16]PIP30904.1 MAG: ribonuclease HII [bacterium (Candidatus Howlettbacteria) CG23_combo_of_CG06-09_8_20_14_all_37_9]PIX99689.1 MAG: ribonuclease HII [bacterium (Candidatus Howlettbacteria) CG_4_10_14_3_um_filter_37_10]PJB06315.1 MAG: ribonuclease HII [bacterium (Candidatus Howlettbacteria) CG_4_9_14_3_um_filter_37_10]
MILDLSREKEFTLQGYKFIAGVDEVGRGPVAGPIVSAAVIMNLNKPEIMGINDSKLLSPKKRLELREKIIENSLCWSIAEVSNFTIDKEGISQSNRSVLKLAVSKLEIKPDFVLIDFFKIPDLGIKSESITHGDAKVYSIACSSILAKVYRDELMDKQAQKYPEYHFHTNKGYLTKKHLEAITEYGWTEIHRLSFWPVSVMMEENED